MSRVLAALSATAILALASVPTSAFAGCYGCYAPPPPPQPCMTCYQQQVIPPQYQTYNETVMVSPGRRIAHRTPARYETVMVPKTVMVEPEGLQYEEVPPQYAAVQDRKSTRLNSCHLVISYAVFCLKKKKYSIYSSNYVLVMYLILPEDFVP